ncbi:hypothetical protein IE81DRAFT_324662 [Ceraceosorus guamensis]|uniref:Methyltransferase domain-containing protein n=1 Tax=Ceraceosorus guamensis TaxID=1522189 RepID=A0A316VV20_9BASI|nr:hypothetical protein IE81DRAFT_324662 [Ceraceosorus guamensis]PWN41282.1 hypothetical protein IE81DRAFT_324662 [Ceraceosorus guamensis]
MSYPSLLERVKLTGVPSSSTLLSPLLGEQLANSHLIHILSWVFISLLSLTLILRFVPGIKTALSFAYHCFLAPIGKSTNQSERLDRFYEGQAGVYDATRSGLLRGRRTMLKLCAAQLREMQRTNPGKPLVWVDVGGGTGWNIEEMSKYFPLHELSQIYLIDLCAPLLEVAKKRFAAMDLKNVQVLCQDARDFQLPGLAPEQKVDLFTCSYSISMIPPFYAVMDRINDMLDPETGIYGVVDFYVSGRSAPSADKSAIIGGDTSRQCGWLSRLFWSHWFELDHVELHPARRDYLEYKFGTIKCFNGRNNFIVPFIVRIPYYIWIGCSRARDTTAAIQAFEVEAGNRVIVPPSFPELSFSHFLEGARSQLSEKGSASSIDTAFASAHNGREKSGLVVSRRRGSDGNASDSSGNVRLDLGPQIPLSSFHYQRRQWRLPFVDNEFASQFRTWIYGFAWEDPYVDMKHFDIGANDSVLCITSAGCNALHYAVAGEPKRIHCIDMNPCQGHILELKLACIAALEYEEFWALFGEGKHADFRNLLDTKISPFLSSHAYQFWRLNTEAFKSNFYFRGYSGHALRLAKAAFSLGRVNRDVKAACEAETIEEQVKIWERRMRGRIINKPLIRWFLSNPAFLWNALGVPINQMNCFVNEGVSTEQYAIDTLDPIPHRSLFKNENYHYRLCLMGNYTKQSCPLYLKPEAFKKLKEDACRRLDAFRLHTDSIVNVLRGLEDASLTRAITMDHMDWYDPVKPGTAFPSVKAARRDADKSISDLDREIAELARCVAQGGSVYYRSAAKHPWYNERFDRAGFKTSPVHIRETGKSIDQVNMYASCWRAERI